MIRNSIRCAIIPESSSGQACFEDGAPTAGTLCDVGAASSCDYISHQDGAPTFILWLYREALVVHIDSDTSSARQTHLESSRTNDILITLSSPDATRYYHSGTGFIGDPQKVVLFLCLDTKKQKSRLPKNLAKTQMNLSSRTNVKRSHEIASSLRFSQWRASVLSFINKWRQATKGSIPIFRDLSVALFLRDDNRYCHFINTEKSSARAAIFEMQNLIFWISFFMGEMRELLTFVGAPFLKPVQDRLGAK